MSGLARGRVFELPLLRVELQATPGLAHDRGRVLRAPHDAARILAPFVEHAPSARRLAAALVDARRRLLAVALLDGREWSACCLRPSEVFEPAIVTGAAGLYLAHRHPSSALWALRSDFQSLEGVQHMSSHVHVDVYDHLIFDTRGRYASLRTSGCPWSTWHSAGSTARLRLSPCPGVDGAPDTEQSSEDDAHDAQSRVQR